MSHQFNHRPYFRIFSSQKRQPHAPHIIVREPQVRPPKTSTRPQTHIRHDPPLLATRLGLLSDNRKEKTERRVACIVCGDSGGTLVATEQGYKHQKCKK